MKIKNNHIPLLIVTGLTFSSVIRNFILNSTIEDGVTYMYSSSILVAALSILVILLSLFLKRGIWVYLLLFLLIASFSEKVNFTSTQLYFSLGSWRLDLISLALLISHVFLNAEYFRNDKNREERESEKEIKVDYFLKRYASKSKEELTKMNQDDLTPEAKLAVHKLLEK